MEGSNSGSHPGSPAVAGLPSFDASRIAVTGRQKFHRYLLCQQPITASAAARLEAANSRALAATSNRYVAATDCSARFQVPSGWSCQKIAASVWSAVRVVLPSAPTRLTSLRSRA